MLGWRVLMEILASIINCEQRCLMMLAGPAEQWSIVNTTAIVWPLSNGSQSSPALLITVSSLGHDEAPHGQGQCRPPRARTGYITLRYSDSSTPAQHGQSPWWVSPGESMQPHRESRVLYLRSGLCCLLQGVSVVVRWPCVCWWTGMDQIYWKILFSIVQFSWKWDQRSNVQSSKMLID